LPEAIVKITTLNLNQITGLESKIRTIVTENTKQKFRHICQIFGSDEPPTVATEFVESSVLLEKLVVDK
jgi:hypothetical protein